VNLRGISALIRERYRIVVVTLVVTIATAMSITFLLPKTYQAEATLIVGNSTGTVTPTLDQTLLSQRLSQTYAAVATQRATLQRVIERLGLDLDPESLQGRVVAEAAAESSLVLISVSAPTPEEAAQVANAIAEDAIETTPAITGRDPETQRFISESLAETQAQIVETQRRADELGARPALTPEEELLLASLQQRLATLQTSYTQLLSLASSASANLATLSDPAVPPTRPASPSIPLNLVLAVLAGLLIGLALAVAADHLDDSVKSPEQVERLVGLPTLGTIGRQRLDRGAPRLYLVATLVYPRSAIAEAYRVLRTNVGFASVDRRVQIVLVTSPLAGEGKTAVAANLAVAFAQDGRSTVLLDADLRRPDVHRLFGVPDAPGLTNLLRDETIAIGDVLVPTEQDGLRILPVGEVAPNPAELLGSNRMRTILESMRSIADVVVIDSAPLQLVADPALLAQHTDGTVVVVSAGKTPTAALEESVEMLRRAGVAPMGIVLNRVAGAQASVYAAYGAVRTQAPGDGAGVGLPVGTTGAG
jgi:capsular exopolysaccharide synthesis family protein